MLWRRIIPSPLISSHEGVESLSCGNARRVIYMLLRMSEKGILECREENGVKIYYPLIPRDAAVQRETDSFLSRVYQGSISTMMNAITRKQKLSKSEIEELYAIIRQAEEES